MNDCELLFCQLPNHTTNKQTLQILLENLTSIADFDYDILDIYNRGIPRKDYFFMAIRDDILTVVNNAKSIDWQGLKDKLSYTQYPKMMENIRGLEREGLLHRSFVKDKDGRKILHIKSGKVGS